MIISMHTCGPWVPSQHGFQVLTADRERSIAQIMHTGISPDEHFANSRLIAAAPDLLESLRHILPLAKGFFACHEIGNNKQFILDAEAAIAKAEGRS